MKGYTMKYPAIKWQDAIPSGNGVLGALVFGAIRDEQIVINHDRLYLAKDRPSIGEVYPYLEEYRQLLREGRYQEGVDFFSKKIGDNIQGNLRPAPYIPAFDIKIHTDTKAAFHHYTRSLNFETGEVSVNWQEEDIRFQRRLFVSRAHDLIALEISSSASGRVDCTLTLDPHNSEPAFSMGAGNAGNTLSVPFEYQATGSDNHLFFTARQKNGQEFGGVARVIVTGGKTRNANGKLEVEAADRVLVLVKLYLDETASSAQKRLTSELDFLTFDYESLLQPHAKLHGELFRNTSLELEGAQSGLSNEEFIMKAYEGEVKTAFIQTMFEYGRYLLISSSRPGGMPANLQGLWNGDYKPAWESDFHNDENIQMNYWAALPGNLAETTLPYFEYYESMLDDYRENARKLFNCRGIFIPIAQTMHGLIYGADQWTSWTGAAAWIAQLFFDYWLFTGDNEFLKNRALPFMKEVIQFYEDFLVEGADGKYLFLPSMSPENKPDIPNSSLVVLNATMDVALAKEVLTNLCTACKVLDIEPDSVEKWTAMLTKMPEYEVNEDGAFREWLYPGLKDNYRHRHVSHIYPLFPGFEISKENNRTLFDAIGVAVKKRLVIGLCDQTGWSLAHQANIYARLEAGQDALECLELLCRVCVGPNLFTYHNDFRSMGITMYWGHGNQPPFQIDANFGITAAVLEMLFFSAPGMLKLLPALPKGWNSGKLNNVLCRGGITLSIEWNQETKKLKVLLTSVKSQEITLKLPWEPGVLSAPKGSLSPSPLGEQYRLIRLDSGKPLELDAE